MHICGLLYHYTCGQRRLDDWLACEAQPAVTWARAAIFALCMQAHFQNSHDGRFERHGPSRDSSATELTLQRALSIGLDGTVVDIHACRQAV